MLLQRNLFSFLSFIFTSKLFSHITTMDGAVAKAVKCSDLLADGNIVFYFLE
jgi:hypothetical protein